MDHPSQLQRSWRLRYGKSAGYTEAVTARQSIFLLPENIESEVGCEPIETVCIYDSLRIPAKLNARRVCVSDAFW